MPKTVISDFFYYSGHGARIPSSNDEIEADHQNECLVTYDFDWTDKHAYTDKEFCELYSQLPYDLDFVTMFDCCHSGGMTRDGAFKARGLTPPDDIRHREIKWDQERGMWIPRTLKLAEKDLFTKGEKNKQDFTGQSLATYKLGRGVPLWSDTAKEFEMLKSKYGHKGPYMPVILEACQEAEYAYEYRHGVTSYGAFTFSITTILRKMIAAKKKVTYSDLIKKASEVLNDLKYDQHPILVGPASKTTKTFFN